MATALLICRSGNLGVAFRLFVAECAALTLYCTTPFVLVRVRSFQHPRCFPVGPSVDGGLLRTTQSYDERRRSLMFGRIVVLVIATAWLAAGLYFLYKGQWGIGVFQIALGLAHLSFVFRRQNS
jgi:hypothetical protein